MNPELEKYIKQQKARNWRRRKARRMGLQPKDWITGCRRFEWPPRK